MDFESGSWVWLQDDDAFVKPATVTVGFDKGSPGAVKTDDGDEVELTPEQTKIIEAMDDQVLDPNLADLITLNELTENSVLHKLRMRFKTDAIYTSVSAILVSVNPFKRLDIVSKPHLERFLKSRDLTKLEPHIWWVAKNAYEKMRKEGTNQSVLVAGESGAGKTEAAKEILRYVAAASNRTLGRDDTVKLGEGEEASVDQKLLQTNPIMEAFGNAKTVRNNNSSRFGKLFSIYFNKEGAICTATVTNYLLEKSRCVGQQGAERNYHIYYQMLVGLKEDPDAKDPLGLGPEVTAELKANGIKADGKYEYLNRGTDVQYRPGDFDTLKETMEGLQAISVSAEDKMGACRSLAAILHLGNCKFEADAAGDGEAIKPVGPIDLAAKLLGIEDPTKLSKALCYRSMSTGAGGRGSVYSVPYSVDQAEAARDAVVKRLHSHIFDWLIDSINVSLAHGQTSTDGLSMFAVLDIFGFEIFEWNSFEQLCINYCNEKLQNFFNQQIFDMELEEYKRQEVVIEDVDFSSNEPCLELIEGKGFLLGMVDEEGRLPKGSDEGFLHKLFQTHGKHQDLKKPGARKKGAEKKSTAQPFVIAHYAADVEYDAAGFMAKNQDFVHPDLTKAVGESSLVYVSRLMSEEEEKKKGGFERRSSMVGKKGGGAKKKVTLGMNFKKQLTSLMTTLMATQPHFVRCIKPNDAQVADIFEANKIVEQLRCTGLLSVCKIRQIGYPVRMPVDEFMLKFAGLGLSDAKDIKTLIEDLTSQGILQEGSWALGKDKIFFKGKDALDLETFKELRDWAVVTIQRMGRGLVYRKRVQQITVNMAEMEKCASLEVMNVNETRRLLDWFASMLPGEGLYIPRIKKVHDFWPEMVKICEVNSNWRIFDSLSVNNF
jgi:myosin heavy subunit